MPEEVVGKAVRLGRHSIGIVRHDRIHMCVGEAQHRGCGFVQLFSELQQIVPLNGSPVRRVHVLARPACMKEGDFDTGSVNQQRLEGDDARRPLGTRLITLLQ